MNLKTISSLFLISIILISCGTSKPEGFTYTYLKDGDRGLSNLIDIDGYFITQRECDSTFFSAFMFYKEGVYCSVTGTDLNNVKDCFTSNEKTVLCRNLSWGLYTVKGDTIKTQTLREEGITYSIIYRDYLIRNDKSLVNINDYVNPNAKMVGYMLNYPSFHTNMCPQKVEFYRTKKAKRNISFCPYIKKKWFCE